MLSHALSCRTAQIVRAFKQSDRFADRDVVCIRQFLGETFHTGRHQRPADPPRSWTQTYHGLHGRGSCPQSHRTRQAERPQSSRSLAEGHGQRSEQSDIQAFFISIGARYKRIRKRPRGKPNGSDRRIMQVATISFIPSIEHWRLSGIPWELNLDIMLLNFD